MFIGNLSDINCVYPDLMVTSVGQSPIISQLPEYCLLLKGHLSITAT